VDRRCVEKPDLDLTVSDHDPLGDRFDNPPPLLVWEGRPAGVQVARFAHDLRLRQVTDLEHIKLGLKRRYLVIQLLVSTAEGLILGSETVLVDHP